jgi:hypothetical protein
MPTPESSVKTAVKRALQAHGVVPFMDAATGKTPQYDGVYYMPVAGPFSVHGVHDFVGVWHGVFWSIETKAPDNPEDATYHQECFRQAVTGSGGISLTGVRSAAAVDQLRELVLARVESNVLDKERV